MALVHNVSSHHTNSSLRDHIARRPLLAYFVIAFGAVWIALLPFVLGQGGLGVLPIALPDIAFILLFIGATLLGPTGGAFIVTAAAEGRPGVRRLLRRYVQWRVGIQWYAVTLFGFFAIYLTAAVITDGTAALVTFASNWQLLASAYLPALLSMAIFPGLAEEPGWRGFALPRLQEAYGPLAGTLLLGLLHGLWHLPVYTLVSGPAALGPFNLTTVVANTVSIMAITVVWTWVFNHAKGSILIAILLHAASNATGQVFAQFVPNLSAQFNTVGFMVIIASAVLLIAITRGRLGYVAAQDTH